LKKRSKKLLDIGAALLQPACSKEQKFFGSFFQKRTASLALASPHHGDYPHANATLPGL
jgi:hypothetical protein